MPGILGSGWRLPASELRAPTPRQSAIGEINVGDGAAGNPSPRSATSADKDEELWLLDKVQLVK
jgi:hypothetical protein